MEVLEKIKRHAPAFFLSYVEVFAAFSSIMILLFVASKYESKTQIGNLQAQLASANEVEERTKKLIESWRATERSLSEIGADPVRDKEMGGMRITVAEKVLFPINEAALKPEGQERIRQIAERLSWFIRQTDNIRDTVRIKVGGHTDAIGGDKINFPLSYERANMISTILNEVINRDAQLVHVVPVAYGSKYPVPGHTTDIDPVNRRITIVLELLSTDLLQSVQ